MQCALSGSGKGCDLGHVKPWVRRASTEGAESDKVILQRCLSLNTRSGSSLSENTNKRDGFKDPELKLIKASRELGHEPIISG